MSRHKPLVHKILLLLIILLMSSCERAPSPPPPAEQPETESLVLQQRSPAENYQQYCAQCHEGGVPKAPHSIVFQMIGTEALLKSMVDGVMVLQSQEMTDDEKTQLAEHLGGRSLDSVSALAVLSCEGDDSPSDIEQVQGVADWGITPENTRFIPAETAGLEASDVAKLGLKWAFAYPGATRARSQPVVAGNTVYVGSQDGTIYA